jgi:transcriptional regulator GlxA family with amidase domain
MTTREFYQSIISAEVSEDITAKASELLAKMDASNAKRKSADSKEKREVRERVQVVLDFLCDHIGQSFTRDDIASATGLSVGQVTAACKPIVVDGTITRAETKVGKTHKVVYTYPIEG